MPASGAECCELLCSILFPPLGVAMKRGCGGDLFINILLTLCGYLPGNFHIPLECSEKLLAKFERTCVRFRNDPCRVHCLRRA